jgi:hypothetical protein
MPCEGEPSPGADAAYPTSKQCAPKRERELPIDRGAVGFEVPLWVATAIGPYGYRKWMHARLLKYSTLKYGSLAPLFWLVVSSFVACAAAL